MNFELLSTQILDTHTILQQTAVKAVNVHISIRNWLIGCYIVEFEQKGEDRAKYGDNLLKKLALKIKIKGLSAPELSRCRQFYTTYPEFDKLVSQQFQAILSPSILGTVSQQSLIVGTLSQELKEINKKKSNIKFPKNYFEKLIHQLSFSHFAELIKIKEQNKRVFYEMLIMKNTMSVRELERSISTLAFERIGLSSNTELAYNELVAKSNPAVIQDIVKSHYFFDFLELPNAHLINENQLEEALIQHLHQFILELGNGFCFEARQKRILIDDEYYFIDLVFYHRILKCHVLLELKADTFRTEHASQLNTYVAYYNSEVKQKDDNPTIGILLCTQKGKKLVEFALAGMDKNLFVSKYLLQLPSEQQLIDFINNELKKIN